MRKKTKKQLSLIVLFINIVVALQMGTQKFAENTGYNRILGKYLIINNLRIYPFFKIIEWSKYKNQAPIAFEKAYNSSFQSFFIGIFFIFLINYERKRVITHGAAKWATKSEIDEIGFFPYKNKKEYEKDYISSNTIDLYKKNILQNKKIEKKQKEEEYSKNGVFIGRDNYGRDLIDNTSGHVMMIAKTGGGKGVSVVLPTLWTWKGSTLINDIKGENWQLTAPYRRETLGHKVFRFEATADGINKISCKYNPLIEIRKGTVNEYKDARLIAETIISPDKTKDQFFGPSAVNYLTGVILHVLYMKKTKVATLSDVYRFITNPSFSVEEKLEQMKQGEHTENEVLFNEIYSETITIDGEIFPKTHPIASRVGADMLGRADKERSGIISSALTELTPFSEPTIARNTSDSDFRIDDLMNYSVPIDLYFVTPPNSVDITSSLLKLFLNQIVFKHTDKMEIVNGENKAYKHRLLLLMDELPAIGKVKLFHDAISYIRGYGMKALIIIQDMKQLKAVYGENNSFLGNMTTTIYYSTNDVDTAKYIEQRLGNETVTTNSKSYKGGGFFSTVNYSKSYIGRPLMRTEEIHAMSEDRSIILKAASNPIKGKLAKWYLIDSFKERAKRHGEYKDNEKSDKIFG